MLTRMLTRMLTDMLNGSLLDKVRVLTLLLAKCCCFLLPVNNQVKLVDSCALENSHWLFFFSLSLFLPPFPSDVVVGRSE